jgi:TrmH family RNA methyltransferase
VSGLLKLVFLRPRNPENLGAIARAMKNFGAVSWALVDPNPLLREPEGWGGEAARKRAVNASELLDQVELCPSLEAAVSDCTWVVGTSMRRVEGKRALLPRAVAEEAVQRGERWALVFGDERNGLTNEDLLRCHDLSSIPTDEGQPSLNLSQAALLYCYEAHLAELHARPRPSPPRATAATEGELATTAGRLEVALEAAGFFRGGKRHALVDLMAPLRRARLTRVESRLWNAALSVLAKREG